MKRAAIAALLPLVLAACETPPGIAAVSASFGNATAANMAAQEADAASSAALRRLSDAFRAGADDIVTFAIGSATLDATARRAVRTQAGWLRRHPQARAVVIGHADTVGGARADDALALRRAENVLDELVRDGIARERLAALGSRGGAEPVIPADARARGSPRAVTMLAGFLPGHAAGPGLDGAYAERVYRAYQTGEAEVTEANSSVLE